MSDLISRSAFADLMCSACNKYFPDEPCEPSECDLCIALANAPAVDAVPVVHGRWVMRGGKLYCSACEQKACVARDSDDFWYTKGTDYCPNCGAQMDGGENNG